MEENNIEDIYAGDFIGIRGTVKIENGEHIVIGRNHWVGQGLETIGSYLICSHCYVASIQGYSGSYYGVMNSASYSYNIYIGSDTTTATTVSMTGLVSPIGTAPGTAANSQSLGGTYYSTSTTPIVLTYQATWNAGTVSGTLGEAGLYMLVNSYNLTNGANSSSLGLVSRLSVADGSFTAFTINTSAALTVTWTVNLTYA